MIWTNWRSLFAIVAVAIVLFLLAAVPAASAGETQELAVTGQTTEPIIAGHAGLALGLHQTKVVERLSPSPGGAYVIGGGSSNTKVTDNALNVPSGGAAGSAETSIRSQTTS